jgi:hypothetical protein
LFTESVDTNFKEQQGAEILSSSVFVDNFHIKEWRFRFIDV